MYDNFIVEDSLDKIKASLYDIYENQEKIIGGLENEEEKATQVQKYIETKDLAVLLIESISSLYERDNNDNNSEIIVKNKNEDNNSEIIVENKQEDINLENNEEDVVKSEDKDEIKDDNDTNNKEVTESNDNKFYLDSRNGSKPNFAYVPESIYIKIKNNGKATNKFYKQDLGKAKGIIVRNDQFMKLSFSRDRQEGVLKEAKAYRMEQARKSRYELEKEIIE